MKSVIRITIILLLLFSPLGITQESSVGQIIKQDNSSVTISHNMKEVKFLFHGPGWHSLRFIGTLDLGDHQISTVCEYTLLVFIPSPDQNDEPITVGEWKCTIDGIHEPKPEPNGKKVTLVFDRLLFSYFSFELDQIIFSEKMEGLLDDPKYQEGLKKYWRPRKTTSENNHQPSQLLRAGCFFACPVKN